MCMTMNYIINNFLLAGETFMPEMNLRQWGFTYSACVPFTKKTKQEYKNSKKQETLGISTGMNQIMLNFNII